MVLATVVSVSGAESALSQPNECGAEAAGVRLTIDGIISILATDERWLNHADGAFLDVRVKVPVGQFDDYLIQMTRRFA